MIRRVMVRLQSFHRAHQTQQSVSLFRLRSRHLRDAFRESRAAEATHLAHASVDGVEVLALRRQLSVLHPRALGERLEPVSGHGPQRFGVVFAANLVQESAPFEFVHGGRPSATRGVGHHVVEVMTKSVLGVVRVRVVRLGDGQNLALGDERGGHARQRLEVRGEAHLGRDLRRRRGG